MPRNDLVPTTTTRADRRHRAGDAARLRRRFLLAAGLGLAVTGAACEKERIVVNPPRPAPNQTHTCQRGNVPLNDPHLDNAQMGGDNAAPAPYGHCEKEVNLGGCSGGSGIFDETETRIRMQETNDQQLCCYVGRSEPCPPTRGRAFRPAVHDAPRTAPKRTRRDWCDVDLATRSLETSSLTPEEREQLADLWLEDAQAEHASVAAFAQLSLWLMQHGAPPDLLRDTHVAALDEVTHANLCFALASHYAGADLGPGPLRVDATTASPTLADLAVATLRDGCLGETAATLEALEAARGTQNPELRRVLERIADDEARHAELGWRIVAWACRQGGEPVRTAVRRQAEALPAPTPAHTLAREATTPEGYGHLDQATRLAITRQCITEVVLPCVTALLGDETDVPAFSPQA